jgi:hypothetical protein
MTWANGSGRKRLAGGGAIGRQRLLAFVVLPALLLRVLVPPGFMPMPAAAGDTLTMAMCPAHAALPTTEPKPDAPLKPTGRTHEPPCAFAAAGTLAPAVSLAPAFHAEPLPADPTFLATVAPLPRPTVRANTPRAPPQPT